MPQPRKPRSRKSNNFVIFPYLRTSEPVYVSELVFRNTDDTKGLSAKDKRHLETISSLFFLADHLRITDMVYAVLPFVSSEEERDLQQKQLRGAQTLFSYLYTSPSQDGTPFLSLEHSSIYIFRESSINKFSMGDNYRTEDLWPSDSLPIFDESNNTPGYFATLNWTTYISVVANSRIYPSAQEMWFNLHQDLYSDLLLYTGRPHNWALTEFFRNIGEIDEKFSNRVMNALDWYNRSASINIVEEVALMNLSIALETLLRLKQGDSLTERFKEAVKTLIGPTEGLDSWLEQFYTARSKIVHEGSWPELMFLPPSNFSRKRDQKNQQSQEEGSGHGSLVAHGRRVFRLCVGAILSGAMVAEETRLASWFVNNQERLKDICKSLGAKHKSANFRLLSVRQDVIDLHEFWLGSEKIIELDTLTAVGKLITKTYLETNHKKVPVELLNLMQQVAGDSSNSDIKEKLERFKELSDAIQTWQGDSPFIRTMQGRSLRLHKMREDPLSILRAFLEYAAMPHIEMRASANW